MAVNVINKVTNRIVLKDNMSSHIESQDCDPHVRGLCLKVSKQKVLRVNELRS